MNTRRVFRYLDNSQSVPDDDVLHLLMIIRSSDVYDFINSTPPIHGCRHLGQSKVIRAVKSPEMLILNTHDLRAHDISRVVCWVLKQWVCWRDAGIDVRKMCLVVGDKYK